MPNKDSHVIEFYGETCPHCISMKPVVAKIEADLKLTVKKLEVWNSPANQKTMEKYNDIISEACGGFAAVPAFVNTKTGQALCGAHDEADIIKLIEGGDCKDNVCMPHTKAKK